MSTIVSQPSVAQTTQVKTPSSVISIPNAASKPSANQPALSKSVAAKPTLSDLLEKYVKVIKITNTSSHFTHEAICDKCGWHSLQLSEENALAMLRQHVQVHWRDVSNQLI